VASAVRGAASGAVSRPASDATPGTAPRANSGAASLTTLRKAVNFIAFQAGWFACVLGAAHGQAAWGVAAALFIVAVHVATAARPSVEARLAVIALGLGAVWEWVMLALGVVDHGGGGEGVGLPPAWIVALWPLFATTLNASLAWLQGRWLVAALLGAVAGPAAYWAGARLGALSFGDPLLFVAELAAGWAVLTPVLLAIAARLAGASPEPRR